MSRIKIGALFFFLSFCFANALTPIEARGDNEWRRIGTDAGPGPVYAMAIDPRNTSLLYAGTGKGVFISENGGVGWSALGTRGLANTLVNALLIDPVNPNTLYAGTGEGVFKSTSSGASWNAIYAGVGCTGISTLFMDSLNILYAGSGFYPECGGLDRSIDGVVSWESLGLTNTLVFAVVADPRAPSILYAGTYGGIYKSTDSGTSWNLIGLRDITVQSLAMDPVNPEILYAGTERKGVFKSTDGGGSWVPFNTGLGCDRISNLVIDPSAPRTLYAGTNLWSACGGVFKSTDGGETWNPSGLSNTYLYALVIDPLDPSVVYAGTYDGVYKSTDGGTSWTPENAGLTSLNITALVIDPFSPTTLYAGTKILPANDRGFLRSTDGGVNWRRLSVGPSHKNVNALALDPLSPPVLYAGTEEGVYKSDDEGESWSGAGLGQEYVFHLIVDPLNPATLHAGTGNGVYGSKNGGASWDVTGLNDRAAYYLAEDPMNPTTLYAGTNGGVYKSSDGGALWSMIGLQDTPINVLATDPVTPETLYAGTSDGVLKSMDGGARWKAMNTGLPGRNVRTLVVDSQNPNLVYLGTWDGGVFKSTNGGENWSGLNIGLTSKKVNAVVIDPLTPMTLYAGTEGGGVFKIEQIATSISLFSPFDGEEFSADSRTPLFQWETQEALKNIEVQFSFDSRFSTVGTSVKGSSTAQRLSIKASEWRKVLLLPGTEGGPAYWRVVGTKEDGSRLESNVSSIFVTPPSPVGNPNLSSTSQSSLPEISWENNGNQNFEVWFGNDSHFTQKTVVSFRIPNPSSKAGLFTKKLKSGQWTTIRKLIGDIAGATLYWYVQSWDAANRRRKTGVLSFTLIP